MSNDKKKSNKSTLLIERTPKEGNETITLTLTVTLTDTPSSVLKRIKAEIEGTARGLANDYDDWVAEVNITQNAGGET